MPRTPRLRAALVLLSTLALLITSASSIRAQNAGRIIDFFQQQLQNELQRQQYEEHQRAQRQHHQALYEQLKHDWYACEGGDISACDRALSSPIITPDNQRQVYSWRNAIVARQQAARDRAAREEYSRQQALREQAVREEQRQNQLRAHAEHIRGCKQYRLIDCNLALRSDQLAAGDRDQLQVLLEVSRKFITDRDACETGQVRSCDAALASPAADAHTRVRLQAWRNAAPPTQRVLALLPTGATSQHGVNIPLVVGLSTVLALLSLTVFWLYKISSASANAEPAVPLATRHAPVFEAARKPVSASTPGGEIPQSTADFYAALRSHAAPQTGNTSSAKPAQSAEPKTGPASSLSPAAPGLSTALFVVGYILLMIPTYILPYLGSNSYAVHIAAGAAGMFMHPGFWLHFAALSGLIAIAWFRGARVEKQWLVVFPVLALVFDLAPGLNMVPMVPTVLHLLAIILGVVSTSPGSMRA